VLVIVIFHTVLCPAEQCSAVREESCRDGLLRWTRPRRRWSQRSSGCCVWGRLQLAGWFAMSLHSVTNSLCILLLIRLQCDGADVTNIHYLKLKVCLYLTELAGGHSS